VTREKRLPGLSLAPSSSSSVRLARRFQAGTSSGLSWHPVVQDSCEQGGSCSMRGVTPLRFSCSTSLVFSSHSFLFALRTGKSLASNISEDTES
jgi:hypothetical protein